MVFHSRIERNNVKECTEEDIYSAASKEAGFTLSRMNSALKSPGQLSTESLVTQEQALITGFLLLPEEKNESYTLTLKFNTFELCRKLDFDIE